MFGINPWMIVAAMVALLASFGAGVYSGHHYGWLQEQAVVATAAKETLAQTVAQDTATQAIAATAAVAQDKIRVITRTITKEVPVYVTAKADSACVVPRGFVRVFNGAAAGVAPVPDPAGQSDDAPAGVGLAAVADATAGNFGTCRATAQTLSDLQAWVRAMQARWNDPP